MPNWSTTRWWLSCCFPSKSHLTKPFGFPQAATVKKEMPPCTPPKKQTNNQVSLEISPRKGACPSLLSKEKHKTNRSAGKKRSKTQTEGEQIQTKPRNKPPSPGLRILGFRARGPGAGHRGRELHRALHRRRALRFRGPGRALRRRRFGGEEASRSAKCGAGGGAGEGWVGVCAGGVWGGRRWRGGGGWRGRWRGRVWGGGVARPVC